MQQSLGVLLAESVQWERCEAIADALLPIDRRFPREAAQADMLIGDDTRVQILACEPENQQRADAGERCGLHTTGLVAQSSVTTQNPIVLYNSGRKHAGENVGELLRVRSGKLGPPL